MTEINLLIELIKNNTIRSKNNETEIKRLNDADNSITELIKNILEKLMELVDILDKRKNEYPEKSMGKIKDKIRAAWKRKGGDKGE